MLHGFKDYLLDLGKSENTAAAYLRDAKLFLVWCKDSFGDEPKQLHRANIQEYISYMRNVRGFHENPDPVCQPLYGGEKGRGGVPPASFGKRKQTGFLHCHALCLFRDPAQ